MKRFISVFVLILSTCLLVSCASIDKGMMTVSDSISSPDPVTGKREINLEAESEEIAKATKYANEFLATEKTNGRKVDSELPEYDRVKRVFDTLIKVAHRRHLPWEVHLIEDEKWNAFTVGGGKVLGY